MKTDIKTLELKQQKIKKKLIKTKEISKLKPIDATSFKEVWNGYIIPPYYYATQTFKDLGKDAFETLTTLEPLSGRTMSKLEKGIDKAIAGIWCGINVAFFVPIIAILETPASLPGVVFIAGQSAVYKNYNKRIEKAKIKVELLEDQNKQIQEEINKLQKQKEEQEMSL